MCTLQSQVPEPHYIEPSPNAPLALRFALVDAKTLVALRQQQLRKAINELRDLRERALGDGA